MSTARMLQLDSKDVSFTLSPFSSSPISYYLRRNANDPLFE